MKRYLSWSGGKDSSASIVLCYEKGIHLDGIIFSVDPIHNFLKKVGECQQIIGIAADEQGRLKVNQKSVLIECGVCEAATFDICRKYDLLSPTYDNEDRGGCWFCPNSSIEDFARLAKEHPELWAELEKLSHDKDICSQSFKYGRSFESVDRQVQAINSQI